MTESRDYELLARFRQTRSEPAFGELVARHIHWVRSAALRQTRDSHLADDVTQGVFIALARKAPTLANDAAIAAWLFQATRYASAQAIRTEIRRKRHEQKAAAMTPEASHKLTEPQADWAQLAPLLDEQVAALRDQDRQAVLLRFYQQRSFVQVGQALGISEEAARKRTDRAVEKLRVVLARRGVPVASAVLGAALVANSTQPASAALLATTTQAAIAGVQGAATASGLALAKGVGQMLAVTKLKAAAVVLVAALGLVGAGVGAAIMLADAAPSVPPQQDPAPQTSGAPAPVDEPEAQVPGLAQLARWDVILTPEGMQTVSQAGRPVASASKVYQALLCNGVEQRRAVREAMATGGVERTSREMDISYSRPGQDKLEFPRGLWFSYMSEDDGRLARVMLVGGSEGGQEEFTRVNPDRLRFRLNHPSMRVNANEFTNGWRWTENVGQQAIVYDGELAAGEAVAFLGQYLTASGRPYHHLVVWETF